jgi:lactaldehyde dehydrogenase/glycolaldehyde dehydrogenase
VEVLSVLDREPEKYVGGSGMTTAEKRPVINPADESTIAEVPEADAGHAGQALEIAQKAQYAWGRKTGPERGAVLRAVADGIRARKEELAQLVVAEQGKTITEARGEVGDAAAGFFDYYATFERAQVGAMFAPDVTNKHLIVRNVPYGVVVGIIPWNYPAALFARKVAPAIIAGNAIVLKPHEETPLAALAQIVEEAGVPPRIVNVVTGAGTVVGDALVRHPITAMVSVTGSVRGGREILAAAQNIVPVSLELGGKAPFVVLDDANLEAAVENAVDARFWNCGQVCTCNERTYVRRGIYDEFVERFVAAASSLRMGDPRREDVQMGPKVSESELEKVEDLVRSAVQGGAEVVLGGSRPEGEEFAKGYWFQPTVLRGTTNDMDIVQNEVFGPVLPIQLFDDFEEVVNLANDSRYGLSAYVFTSDLHKAMRAIDDIDFGEIYVNKIGPEQLQGFHTGYRLSGMGGDDGPYGYERYLRCKTVYLHYENFGTPAELHP